MGIESEICVTLALSAHIAKPCHTTEGTACGKADRGHMEECNTCSREWTEERGEAENNARQ